MIDIVLLGPPAIRRDGEPARSPRGLKSWALLAYLLMAERPPARRQLAELLFADADDPLGALRWTLAELRRALGVPEAFRGDPVIADLPADAVVDVADLMSGTIDVDRLLAIDGDLLGGVHLDSCWEFESWLGVARHRASAMAEDLLHREAAGLLATGQAPRAVTFASKVVELNPLAEANHELLVRSLAEVGDHAAAVRQATVCEELLLRELGIHASPAVRDAATSRRGTPAPLGLSGRAAALSQLEAGRAAIAAGAVDAGLQCIRNAVAESARSHETALQAASLCALGDALVHSVRGRDEEGSVALREAARLAVDAGDAATAATAYRELGFVDVQAGRRGTADDWLRKAAEIAETDEELAAVFGVRGMNASDRADYPQAFDHLAESVERARRCADDRQEAWSLSIVGRAHLLRGDRDEATRTVGRSLELVQRRQWIAFLPWPQSLQGELTLLAGDIEGAGEVFEQAWALACQIGDPCWEGISARGMAQVRARRGDADATAWFDEASNRCTRLPDAYRWVHIYVLDAATSHALDIGDGARAERLLDRLAALAARGDMREFVVRAAVHRSRLGDASGLVAARHLSGDIDNPALAGLVDAAASRAAG